MLLAQQFVRRLVHERRRRQQHARRHLLAIERVEEMVGAAHVDRECRVNAIPGADDVRFTGAVVDDRWSKARDRRADRRAIEQVDRLPRRGGHAARRSAAWAMPRIDRDASVARQEIKEVASGKAGGAGDENRSRHGVGVTAARRSSHH